MQKNGWAGQEELVGVELASCLFAVPAQGKSKC